MSQGALICASYWIRSRNQPRTTEGNPEEYQQEHQILPSILKICSLCFKGQCFLILCYLQNFYLVSDNQMPILTRAMSTGQQEMDDHNKESPIKTFITKDEVEALIKDAVSAAIEKFTAAYTELHNKKLSEFEDKLEGLEHTIKTTQKELKDENVILKNKCEALEANVQSLTYKLKLIHSAHNDLEQYGRKNNLLFRGLATKEHETPEKTVCDFINNTLSVSDMNRQRLTVAPTDIDIAHPIKTKNDHPVIIARFVRRSIKMAVIKARKQLKGKPVSIADDLTHKNQVLLKDLSASPNVEQAWTWDGKIIANIRGEAKSKVFALKDTLP